MDYGTNAKGESRLLVNRSGAVATIVLNRPEKLNALDRHFWPSIQHAFAGLEADTSVRAVVIFGAGERAFSAGGDIVALSQMGGLADRRAYQVEAMAAFRSVERSPLPTIAAINGIAFGGGCELALACDIVIAASHAIFAMPEAQLGLVPGYGIVRGPDRFGRGMTKLMIMARQQLDAETAMRTGFVQDIVPMSDLLDRAGTLAATIAESSPLALEIGKRIIDRDLGQEEIDWSIEALSLLQVAPDVTTGMQAFLEKRRPEFGSRR